MRRIAVFSIVFCLLSTFCFCKSPQAKPAPGEGIQFEEGTLKEVLAKAKAENKLVFVDAYASWCGPCQRMAQDIFPQKAVGDYFNATFINVKFDMERGEGPAIATRYQVDRFPTFLLLDGDGALKGKMIGGSPADDFINRIKQLALKANR